MAPPLEEHTQARSERQRRAWWTTLTSIGSRGVTLVLSLVSVPLTLGYLDKERFGVWITIGSLLGWLGVADLGVGYGLTNALVAAEARKDRHAQTQAVTACFVVVTSGALAGAALLASAFRFVPWARVLAAGDRVPGGELTTSVAICAAVFFIGFPLGLIDKIYAGLQEGFVGNYWSTAGNVLSFAALVLVARFGSGLPILVLALSAAPVVVKLANAVQLLVTRPWLRPRLDAWRGEVARRLMRSGVAFLILQLAQLGMWQNDNIIVAQMFGAAAVTSYSIAFRLCTFYIGLVSMWLAPLWPAYGDAAARGDDDWIRRTVARNTSLVVGVTALAGAGMVLFGRFAIRLWVGEAVLPERGLLIAIAVYMVVLVWCMSIAVALNGLGRLRGQMFYGGGAVPINVACSILLARRVGMAGVCWGTTIAALFPAIATTVELRRVLRARAGERAHA